MARERLIKRMPFNKKGSYLFGGIFILSLIFLFQNCQQAGNSFTTEEVHSSSVLQLSLTALPANTVNCNDGLKVTISTNGTFLAEAPYSFDGGTTWDILAFKVYNQTTTIEVGQIMVKDGDGKTIANSSPYTVDMIKCSLAEGPVSPPIVEGTGAWTSSASCNGTTQVISYSCVGGNGQCSGAKPSESRTADSPACGYTPPPTGTWTSSTSCSGTTQVVSYSCVGGNGQCSGTKPSGTSTANSPACSVPPTGTWTSSTGCNGTTQVISYSCTGGNGQCSGSQPAGTATANSPACGYTNPPTGVWTSSTSCNGTTQVISYSCTGGNGQCSGSQPSGSSTANSPACGYSDPPTGAWTPSTSCSGYTQIISFYCTGGNGQCSGSQPAGTATANSPACGYVAAPTCESTLNTCAELNAASDVWVQSYQTGIRVGSGDSGKIYLFGNNQKIVIHKGAQKDISPASFTGTALYFERPASEYNFSSMGNGLVVTDSCGRKIIFTNQGNYVSLYFSDGYFQATIETVNSIPTWKIKLGSTGGNLAFIPYTEDIASFSNSIKGNLTPSNNSQSYFTCPLIPPL